MFGVAGIPILGKPESFKTGRVPKGEGRSLGPRLMLGQIEILMKLRQNTVTITIA